MFVTFYKFLAHILVEKFKELKENLPSKSMPAESTMP